MKKERMEASKILTGPTNVHEVEKYKESSFEEKKDVIEQIRRVSFGPSFAAAVAYGLIPNYDNREN